MASNKEFDPFLRAKRSPTSLRAAIDAKCWDCQGRDSDPAPRWRIGNCEMADCPLHPVRPYQSNQSRQMPAALASGGAYMSSDRINEGGKRRRHA